MSSTEPSFPNQSPLLMAYHPQGYLFNPQKQVDFLSLSQNSLNNHINPYALTQNPQALLSMGLAPQAESPEKAIISQNIRKIPNEQMALLAMAHPSNNDPFTNRPQGSPMASSLQKRVESSVSQTNRQNLERTLPPHANNQLNSIVQLLEANDLKAQAQKNLNDLFLYQFNNNKSYHSTTNGTGFPYYLNYQNPPMNYGGLVPGQNFYYGQNLPEKVLQPSYASHNDDIIVLDNPTKKPIEIQQPSYKKVSSGSAQDAIIVHDHDVAPKTPKSVTKNMEEVKLINFGQSSPQVINQPQIINQKQNESLHVPNTQIRLNQIPIQSQASRKITIPEPMQQGKTMQKLPFTNIFLRTRKKPYKDYCQRSSTIYYDPRNHQSIRTYKCDPYWRQSEYLSQ